MLTVPTAEEIIDYKLPKRRPISELTLNQEERFQKQMIEAQRRLIKERHLDNMNPEDKVRAMLVLNGCYTGLV